MATFLGRQPGAENKRVKEFIIGLPDHPRDKPQNVYVFRTLAIPAGIFAPINLVASVQPL